jgi:hypothetical protein
VISKRGVPFEAPELRDGAVVRVEADNPQDLGERFVQTVAGKLGTLACPKNYCIDHDDRGWTTKLTLRGRVVFRTTCGSGHGPGCEQSNGLESPVIIAHADDLVRDETIVLVEVFQSGFCPIGLLFFMYVHADSSVEYVKISEVCVGKTEIHRLGRVAHIRLYDQVALHFGGGARRPLPDMNYTYDLVGHRLTKD